MGVGETVTVVVCTYNRASLLGPAVRSIFAQDLARERIAEIVIVDDGSTDGTDTVLRAFEAESPVALRCVTTQSKRRGVAQARNAGIEAGTGAWVAFFDDDQRADPAWLRTLLGTAEETGALCVGGSIALDLPETAVRKLGPVARGLLGEHIYMGPAAPFAGSELPSSGNLLIARRAIEAVGRFDAGQQAGGEDTDLMARVRAAGLPMWKSPGALVYHAVPEYRLDRMYFRWVSLRWGMNFAQIDRKLHGGAGGLLRAGARLGHALVSVLPRYAAARMRGDKAAARDRRCQLWRAEGYVRDTLHALSPRLFPEREFLRLLHFRSERQLFGGAAPAPDASAP